MRKNMGINEKGGMREWMIARSVIDLPIFQPSNLPLWQASSLQTH